MPNCAKNPEEYIHPLCDIIQASLEIEHWNAARDWASGAAQHAEITRAKKLAQQKLRTALALLAADTSDSALQHAIA